ncbi:hypothetical protein N9S80_03155 [Flavobacteriaceae bacterium]|jgi:hypothetical protein|nr:hypothetical protein [Flavobacteriaceae bacterium]
MTVIKDPKKKYLKLFTLGKKFSSKTFSDNTKKLLLNALALFVVVTFTFYVESVGDNYENRQKYLDISKKILDELYLVSDYTDTYISQTDNLLPMYKKQIDRWDNDNDSIFIDYFKNRNAPNGKYYYAPLGLFTNTKVYNPPRIEYKTFSKGTQDFFLINPEISNRIFELYEGSDIQYLSEETAKNEEKYINQFMDRLENKWVEDLPSVDIESKEFWIKNRKYFQNDKFLKHLFKKRYDLWRFIVKDQLSYQNEIIKKDIKSLDSVIQRMNNEKHFLYWKLD